MDNQQNQFFMWHLRYLENILKNVADTESLLKEAIDTSNNGGGIMNALCAKQHSPLFVRLEWGIGLMQ